MNHKYFTKSIIFLLLIMNHSFAIDKPYYNFGVRGGFNISSFDSQPGNISVNPAFSLCTSGYYSEIFYIHMGISYIARSARLNDIIVIPHPHDSTTPINKWDYKFTISYFQFGLGVGFYLFKNFSVLGGVGISLPGLNMSVEKTRKEFIFYYDPSDKNYSKYYYISAEGSIPPQIDGGYNLGIRYDYERIFFEISYMGDFFQRSILHDLERIDSTIGSIFITIGYNIFYHVTK